MQRVLGWWMLVLGSFALVLGCGVHTVNAAGESSTRILSGHTLPSARAFASSAALPDTLELMVSLRHSDEIGFQRYLQALYDRGAPEFGHFLSQQEIAERFGPTQADYDAVATYLSAQGFSVRQDAANRLTLSATASRAASERAFGIHIGSYRVGPRDFFANDRDPALPTALADKVLAISGLSNLAQPHALLNRFPPQQYYQCPKGIDPAYCNLYGPLCAIYAGARATGEFLQQIGNSVNGMGVRDYVKSYNGYNKNVQTYYANCLNNNFTSRPATRLANGSVPWKDIDGSGQVLGLVEFDSYQTSDVSDYLTLIGVPAATIDNLSSVAAGGGASFGPAEDEVLLDIDTVMSLAPGARVIVYGAASPGAGGSFQQVLQKMLNDGLVTIISNSWAYCEDQTSLADVQGIDTILQSAQMSGISVFSGSGDSGSTCLDGSANTIAVPADSPSLTAVGGTSLVSGAGGVYKGETWWNGGANTPPSGAGGFGISRFFARPSYQTTFSSASGRSIPDVVTQADPANGVTLCQADAGGCPTASLYGGTSMAAPIWAAFTALVNQARGSNLGFVNSQVYGLANTGAFHSAASMGSDFAHVGLGSPNVNALRLALDNIAPTTPDASVSGVLPLAPPIAQGTDPSGVAADGTTTAILLVTLRDTDGNTVGGKTVSLTAAGSHAAIAPANGATSANDGSIQFKVTDTFVETPTFTAQDTTDGITLTQTPTLPFVAPPPTSTSINASPNAQMADGRSVSTVTVTLNDTLSRPIAGKQIQLAQSGNSIIATDNPAVTDASGEVQFLVTDQLNETVTYTATDVTDADLAIPDLASVVFSGGDGCGNGAAPLPGPGYAISAYASGFPTQSNLTLGGITLSFCAGVGGIAFDSTGNLYVSEILNGDVYKFAPGGGIASMSNRLPSSTLGAGLGGLAYSTDGNLYGERFATSGNFTTGAILKIAQTDGSAMTVASNLNCPFSLAADPLSGDVFYTDGCFDTGMDDPAVHRVANPGSGSATVSTYATTNGAPNGGLTFASDGTLYVCGFYNDPGVAGLMETISATNQPQPATVTSTGITCSFSALANGSNPEGGGAQSLLVGTLRASGFPNSVAAYDMTVTPPVYSGATLVQNDVGGQKILGPDQCVYLSASDAVYRVTNADGSCPLTGLSPNPSIVVTPQDVPPIAPQGTALSFDISFPHGVPPLGTAITVTVNGANTYQHVGYIAFSNTVIVSYAGVNAGDDSLVAYATLDGAVVASTPVNVTWTPGKHTTALIMNTAATGANLDSSAPVSATLLDLSLNPVTPIAGATVVFSVVGQSCSAPTDANGLAQCRLTETATGKCTLGASYAGDATHLPTSTTESFAASNYDVLFTDGFEAPGNRCGS